MKTDQGGGGDSGDELDEGLLDIFGRSAVAAPEGGGDDDEPGEGDEGEGKPDTKAKPKTQTDHKGDKGKRDDAGGDEGDDDEEVAMAQKLLRGLSKLRGRSEREAEAARVRPSRADAQLREELLTEMRAESGKSNKVTNLILTRMLRQEIRQRLPAEAQPEHQQRVFDAAVGLAKSGLFKDENSLLQAAIQHAGVENVGESRTPRTATSTPDVGAGAGGVKRPLSPMQQARRLFEARERGAPQSEIDAIARLPRANRLQPSNN